MSAELRRHGFRVNHKKVLRLMRNDNLLAIRKRRYVLTTNSDERRAAYPNWAQTLQVDGIDQLWQADITYVRLRRSFVYLAVVMDAYSRRVVGWGLGPSLEAVLALKALRKAMESRRPRPGLVHHSDQGAQYVSMAYVGLLEGWGALVSMSRRGNPYDNAPVESFMKTLKSEEVNLQNYRSMEQARASIADFIDAVYNQRRLHSSLGYRAPAESEATAPPCEQLRNPSFAFSVARATRPGHSPRALMGHVSHNATDRLDEMSAGRSLGGCNRPRFPGCLESYDRLVQRTKSFSGQ